VCELKVFVSQSTDTYQLAVLVGSARPARGLAHITLADVRLIERLERRSGFASTR